MALFSNIGPLIRRSRVLLLFLGAGILALWVLFFDSHSIASRVQLMAERSDLTAANAVLQERIDTLEVMLSRPLSEAEIERLAREDYFMSRPGETVYSVRDER